MLMDESGFFRERDYDSEKEGDFDAFVERARERFGRVVETIRTEYDGKPVFDEKMMSDLIIPMVEKEYTLDSWYLRDLWNFKMGVSDVQIKERILRAFNMETNCGGYALEIACAIFSNTNSLEESKENILRLFPFVREYDWGELAPHEYLVLYRHENGGSGHHFVKYADGEFTEKCGCEPIRNYEGWSESYSDWSEEIIFAVSRDHDMLVRDENGKRIWSFMV